MNAGELFFTDFEIKPIEYISQSWGDKRLYSGYEVRPRPYSGLMLVTGDVEMKYTFPDGRYLLLRKNDLLYLPSGSRYLMNTSALPDDTQKGYDQLFNFDLFDTEGNEILLSDEPFILTHDGARFSDYFALLASAFRTPRRSMLCVKSEAYRLMKHVLSFCSGTSNTRYPIRAGLDYLEKNWNQNTPISYLAELCGMSESYFRRLFNRYAGMSPVEYRNRIRIAAAKSMLATNTSSINEISLAIGFEDRFYFSRLFSQIEGMSPSAYARLQKF